MVRKAAQAIPNQLLRRARLERGWTQKAWPTVWCTNNVMVMRWERGTAFPSAYYVERLCKLFELRASDLGLIQERVRWSRPTMLPVDSGGPAAEGWEERLSSMPPRQQRPTAFPLPLDRARSRDACAPRPLPGRLAKADPGRDYPGRSRYWQDTLASTFLPWAASQGATLLQGRAFEMGGRLPYQPLVHALSRQLESEQAPEALLGATWLSELSRILPELHDRYPHRRSPREMKRRRIRLFEAVTRLGQALGERTRLCFSR